jgi:hypothetical protein
MVGRHEHLVRDVADPVRLQCRLGGRLGGRGWQRRVLGRLGRLHQQVGKHTALATDARETLELFRRTRGCVVSCTVCCGL